MTSTTGLAARTEAAAAAGHTITVTRAEHHPVGRAFFECTCGIERRFASTHLANLAARAHLDTYLEHTGEPS